MVYQTIFKTLAFQLSATILLMQLLFQLKHFLADYPLQTAWMLKKFEGGYGWILPLTAHCLVHALGTAIVLVAVSPVISVRLEVILVLATFDFVIHFGMDRIKASPHMLGKYQTLTKSEMLDIKARKANLTEADHARLRSNWMFWQTLGIDQSVHHVTHDLIWFAAVISVMVDIARTI